MTMCLVSSQSELAAPWVNRPGRGQKRGGGVGLISTYSLCFFLGPGLPRGLGSPLGVAAPGAPRFTPLFLGPSAGGPMAAACGAGVPGAGVFGVESEAFSLELGAAGSVFEVAGDSLLSLTGDSSLTDSGSTMRRSFSGDSFKVTMRLSLSLMDAAGVDEAAVDEAGVAGLDFRRSLSLDAGVVVVLLLLDAAMTTDDDKGGRGSLQRQPVNWLWT